ncbi:MAG: glycerol-3-phosphate 1-O-acyltransferase PlsY [Clostridia bacterium]|nr:glycerol-3-phosphate 1-O-acyltransferase PlsY [Clostridia bacterium]
MAMTVIVTIVAAYLIGSINFAVIFAKAFTKKDVRELGSGNAGATNVLRSAGLLPGILTFVFDAFKGFVASYMGKIIFDYMFAQTGAELSKGIIGAYICGVACMLGHIFPFFFGFKGGKGVAISVGIFAVCCPIAIIIGLCVFAAVTFISKYVSLGSVLATITVVVLSIFFTDKTALALPQIAAILIMGFIVIIKHKDNIKRLLAGSESKIKIGRK